MTLQRRGLIHIRNAQLKLSSLAFLFNEERKFKAQQTKQIFYLTNISFKWNVLLVMAFKKREKTELVRLKNSKGVEYVPVRKHMNHRELLSVIATRSIRSATAENH